MTQLKKTKLHQMLFLCFYRLLLRIQVILVFGLWHYLRKKIITQYLKYRMQNQDWINELVLGVGVAVFPSIGFVCQHQLIHNQKSVGTFSINVCGVMFLSNFLRIGFFIYKEFSIALLAQSILNILMQILLLRLCVETMGCEGYYEATENKNVQVNQSLFKPFWRWRKIMIVIALGGFSILSLAGLIRRYEFEDAGQVLGYAALIAETFLLIPQLIQNLKQKQVKGISYVFVSLNTFQDLLELFFVVKYAQPLQFIVFNVLQVLANLLLILQILFYKKCCQITAELKQSKVAVQQQHAEQQQMIESHIGSKLQTAAHQFKKQSSPLSNPLSEEIQNQSKKFELS